MPYLFHPGFRPLLLPAVIAALLAAQNSQAQRFSEAGTPVSLAQREDKEFATPIEDCPTGQPADAKGRSSSATSNGSVIAQAGVDIFTADRKSTRLNSSHLVISYAVFCLKKKTNIDCSNSASQ